MNYRRTADAKRLRARAVRKGHKGEGGFRGDGEKCRSLIGFPGYTKNELAGSFSPLFNFAARHQKNERSTTDVLK